MSGFYRRHRHKHGSIFEGLARAHRVGMSKQEPPWKKQKCIFGMTWKELVKESYKIIRRNPIRVPKH